MASKAFLERRSAIISFFDRMPLYDYFAIEISASPDQVVDHYVKNVKWADLIILVLQSKLRPGVAKEFDTAKRNRKRIFAYIQIGKKSPDLKAFIKEVQEIATTTEFSDTVNLIDKIEKDLLEDLVTKYVELYQENLSLRDELRDLRSGKEPQVLEDFHSTR